MRLRFLLVLLVTLAVAGCVSRAPVGWEYGTEPASNPARK